MVNKNGGSDFKLVTSIYRKFFNFREVNLSWRADFSNFRVFIFADAGS